MLATAKRLSTGNPQLDNLFGDKLELLGQPDVVEISANPNGEVYVDRLGAPVECAGTLAARNVDAIIRFCATAAQTTVTKDNPIFSGVVPGTGCRIEGLLPPVVANASFSIRRQSEKVLPLSAFRGFEQHREDILEALRGRQNIIISGGTGSGKTSLTNAMLAELCEIEPQSRLLVIEDTQELRPRHANRICLLTSDKVNQLQLLQSALRLKPDRILVGECRDGRAAHTLLKTWNTGHPGGITTLHANSAPDAIGRLAALCTEAVDADQTAMIRKTVGLVIHIERTNIAPTIKELYTPETHQ